jgi:hypothetical protein
VPGGIASANVAGEIQSNYLYFEGKFDSNVVLGTHVMQANLNVNSSSNWDTPIGVSGKVHTPIGIIVDVSGSIGRNGVPSIIGNFKIDQKIGPFGFNSKLQFEFGGKIWVYFYGDVCVAGQCFNETFILTKDWNGITNEKLCILTECISIMDVYNAIPK